MSSVKTLPLRLCLPILSSALCLLLVRGGFTTGLCLIPTPSAEVPPYAASARSVAQIQEPNHPRGHQPSPRADRRHPRLGGAATARPGNPSCETEERCRSTTTFACHPGRHGIDGYAQAHLSGGGRPHPLLRPGALLVRADRDTVDPGLHYHPGLHRVDGTRRDQAYQSARGAHGGETQAGRPQDTGGRYHSTGGIDPLSQRDGAHEWIS